MRPDRSCRTAFVLQGGGALGAYQAGAACALEASGIRPDIVAGISIGAINAALIAGNPPGRRAERRIGPEHIMASGALPPGFPPVEIDGAWFWDGGLMSNTPLARVVETRADHQPLVIWQVDLFSARGPVPHSVWTVEAREKDIRYSSRTRAITDRTRQMHDLACALHAHADALPEALKAHPAVAPLLDSPARGPLTLIHLIYRAKPYETGAKDYDFSRASMTRHWRAGEADVARCLAHPLLAEHDPTARGMHVFDLADGQHLKETPHDGR